MSIRWRACATSALTACSLLISIRAPMRAAASRTFWPRLPIARESWSSSTMHSRVGTGSTGSPSAPISGSPSSSAGMAETRVIFAGESAFCAYVMRSSEYWMMSMRSPRSSRMIACTRAPRMPTHAPTGSTSRSRDETATFARSPGWRTQPRITTVPS